MNIEYDIIDFHTHPFIDNVTNICAHKEYCNMSIANTKEELIKLGIKNICGSVVRLPGKETKDFSIWEDVQELNNTALRLREIYEDFYIPGFHIHPSFVRESCEEIERMNALGVKLVGELVPYLQGWNDYSCKEFSEILDVCEQYDMVVSFHSMGEDEMDKMIKSHPNIKFVAAHPGEYSEFMRHMDRMKMSDNYYLDISGYGIFRHGMLRHAIDKFGAERFLFGSDYPTCNVAMYIGGVYFDSLISHNEKKMIFSENAKRLLSIDSKSMKG